MEILVLFIGAGALLITVEFQRAAGVHGLVGQVRAPSSPRASGGGTR
jgi:hypothetical protein